MHGIVNTHMVELLSMDATASADFICSWMVLRFLLLRVAWLYLAKLCLDGATVATIVASPHVTNELLTARNW